MLKVKPLFLLLITLLVGCAGTPVSYQANLKLTKQETISIIDQVIMEQPREYRPEYVKVTDNFISYDSGTVSRQSGLTSGLRIQGRSLGFGFSSGGKVVSRQVTERIYFNSIEEISLLQKGDWYQVRVVSQEPSNERSFRVRNINKAQRLIDAISFMRALKADKTLFNQSEDKN